MSGFSNNTERKTFFGMFNGKFTVRITAEEAKSNPEAVTRVNKEGTTVHELHYSEFTGLLTKIATEKHDKYGPQIIYQFLVKKNIYELKMGLSSSQAQAINFRLPNAIVENEITLHTFLDKEGNTVLWMSQDGQKVFPLWTKDHPNGLPQAKKVMFNGEEKWDFYEQRTYVLHYLNQHVLPKLKPVPVVSQPDPEPNPEDIVYANMMAEKAGKVVPTPAPDVEDDLPF